MFEKAKGTIATQDKATLIENDFSNIQRSVFRVMATVSMGIKIILPHSYIALLDSTKFGQFNIINKSFQMQQPIEGQGYSRLLSL